MKAIGVIAALTVKEAVRRRLFIISLLVAIIFFLLSLLPLAMGQQNALVGPNQSPFRLPVLLCVFMGMPLLRFFSSLQAIVMGTSALAGEIERGTLLVVLPRPITRGQVLLGKWLGINLVMAANVAVWVLLLWASLFIQLGYPYPQIWKAAGFVFLYPVLFSSLALMFGSFTGPTLATGLTILCGGVAWAEGILKVIGGLPIVNLPILVRIGHACAYVVPISHVDRWVDRMLGALSPTMIAVHLNRPPDRMASTGDLVYVALYTLLVIAVGLVCFQRRDV